MRRDDLFLTTKIWVDNYAPDKLVPSLEDSLRKLRTDHVDLTLIHWPAPDNGVALDTFMTALADAKAQGLTRRIGISNFNIALTKEAIAAVGKDAIATNQIELAVPAEPQARRIPERRRHPRDVVHDARVRQGARRSGDRRDRAASRRDARPGRARVGAAARLLGDPSSTKRENLASNLLAQTLRLTDEDMAQIAALERNGREVDPAGLAPKWD